MKKILTILTVISLIIGVSSCKTNTSKQQCKKAQTEQCVNNDQGCVGDPEKGCAGNVDHECTGNDNHECCQGDPNKPCCKDNEKPEN